MKENRTNSRRSDEQWKETRQELEKRFLANAQGQTFPGAFAEMITAVVVSQNGTHVTVESSASGKSTALAASFGVFDLDSPSAKESEKGGAA